MAISHQKIKTEWHRNAWNYKQKKQEKFSFFQICKCDKAETDNYPFSLNQQKRKQHLPFQNKSVSLLWVTCKILFLFIRSAPLRQEPFLKNVITC